MNFIAYIKSLLPRFSKDRLTEEARITLAELEGMAIPSYKAAVEGLSSKSFTSKEINEMEKTFKRMVKTSSRENLVGSVFIALETLLKNHKFIQDNIEKNFEEEVIVSGISVLKVNLIRLLEFHTFCTRYSLKLLNYIYILETQEVSGNDRYTKDSLSPADITWIKNHFFDFCTAMSIVTKSEKDLSNTVEKIPDISLAEGAEAVLASVGDDKSDPLNTRLVAGFTNNPIFHFRLIVAEYQANRYKEKKELKTILELRLLNLQKNMEKNPDAALEKEIEYTQSRVDKLNHYILQAEGV